jgi:hypothetical protein
MAEGMMNNPMAAPEGAPMDQGAGGMPQQAVSMEDAVLDMHLTQDVKTALQGKGIDISAVADRGPKEPVVVIPVSVIVNKYGGAPEEAMKSFVQEMTQGANNQQASAGPEMAAAGNVPRPTGLGAPQQPMDRRPMTA